MKKSRYDVANVAPGHAGESAGVAHALNLLLLAIAKTNPSVGALLDEFTAMHRECHAELQALAGQSQPFVQVLATFAQSSRLIYHRLSMIDAEQSAGLHEGHGQLVPLVRFH